MGSRPTGNRRAVGTRTTHARLDLVTPQSGLFRVVSDSPRSRRVPAGGFRWEVEHDGVVTEFRAGGQLTATEWRVLLAAAALAGLDGERVGASTDNASALWSGLASQGVAAGRDGLRLVTSAYALLREAGLTDGGDNRRRLTESLTRLATVRQFLRQCAKVISGANLLSFAHDEESGNLVILLSAQVARAALGESKQHARVSLTEVRQLSTPAAVILHGVLSARMRVGGRATYHLDTLADLAYGPTDHPATRRSRRRSITTAVADLAKLVAWRWTVADGNVAVERIPEPRRTAHALPSHCARSTVALRTPGTPQANDL